MRKAYKMAEDALWTRSQLLQEALQYIEDMDAAEDFLETLQDAINLEGEEDASEINPEDEEDE